jgi:Kef-type K+ transport system membrane component KefB
VTAAPRRLIVYYAILAAFVVAVVTIVFAAGSDEKVQPSIAGGYDVAPPAARCTGPQMDVRQSGQFVGLQKPNGTVISRARLRDGRLKGSVRCADGSHRQLVAPVATGTKGVLMGTLGGAPLRAELKRDPPTAGALRPRPPPSIAGKYKITPRSDCLGGAFELEKAGGAYAIKGGLGRLTYRDGAIAGRVTCRDKSVRPVTGMALNRDLTLNVPAGGPGTAPEKVDAAEQRDFTKTVAAFFLAVVVVMLFARLMGATVARWRQPRVMGEVLAGILLGPTVLGALFPDLQRAIFPTDVIPVLGVAANLGLIFYMFLVGLELDLSQLRGRLAQTAAISNTGVAIPMLAGIAVALPTYSLVGPPAKGGFTAFALFMGVSMSITAFPVLARILVERRMLKRPVGALALASAAIDDISAWFLIALATAVATSGGGIDVVRTILLAAAFCLVMGVGVRPLVARVSRAYDEAGRVPVTWITAIFAGVLLAAFTTEEIGIALIFGGFIAGTIMPRHAGLTEDVTHRMEDFVVLLLLPLFFAYTGLKTNVLLIDRAELIVLTVVLLVVAIACKFGGTVLASRVTGLGWRESAVLGTLMNTRGLTELIVLNLALEKGVISEALFAALVVMALVTTFMAGPVLNRLDPNNEFGEPVEAELDRARRATAQITPIPIPERSILVAPQTEAALAQLLAVAEPLATSEPARELILARLIEPPRGAAVRGGLQTESFLLADAAREVEGVRGELLARNVPARAVAFTSADAGRDLAKLADREGVDLVLVDGRRPLLGDGVPRGDVGSVLRRAPSDVAVLVAREDAVVAPGADAPLLVPFGGAEHDWAALELGAWLASATGARLQMLGAGGDGEGDGEGDASRVLATASLLVQRFVGVAAEPLLAEPGREGLVRATAGAGLLVIGLSERWREEGLGPVRREIAAAAPAPILFVRRGLRPGALAPAGDVTQFTWSHAGVALG